MKQSIPRLRAVKFKSGGEIRLLPDKSASYRTDVVGSVQEALAAQSGRVAGFAFVVWGPDGTSTAVARVNEGNSIPSILVPDFVRNRLLADRIERWTIESINEQTR